MIKNKNLIEPPEFIFKKFENNFGSQPSIIEFEYDNLEVINKLIQKSHIIWFKSVINNKNIDFIQKCVEYDQTGIYIYYSKLSETKLKIFILTTVNKLDISEFTIKKILKINENGDNGTRITREN